MLAYEETGKYVSERHAEAKAEGKLTAGQVARILRNRDVKITAKELKRYATEWHHSGFYKGSNGSTMGRTYFFPVDTDFDALVKKINEARMEESLIAREPDVERYFFCTEFEIRYDGGRSRSRKRYQPIASFVAVQMKPSQLWPDFKNNCEMIKDDYELLKQFEGEDLEPYETFRHFKERMLNRKEVA